MKKVETGTRQIRSTIILRLIAYSLAIGAVGFIVGAVIYALNERAAFREQEFPFDGTIALYSASAMIDGPIDTMMMKGVKDALSPHRNASIVRIEGPDELIRDREDSELVVGFGNEFASHVAEIIRSSPLERNFLIIDDRLHTMGEAYVVAINRREQLFVAGYLAAQVTRSGMMRANPALRVAIIYDPRLYSAAIVPDIALGLGIAEPAIEYDVRNLTNYSEQEIIQIVASVVDEGSDVVIALADRFNRIIAREVQRARAYVLTIDAPASLFTFPSTIAHYGAMFETIVYNKIDTFVGNGGRDISASVAGYRENMVDFGKGSTFIVKKSIRREIADLLERIRSGDLKLAPSPNSR